MAGIGANHPCFAPFSEAETKAALPTYGTGIVTGKLVSGNLTITNRSGEQYADDDISEQINEFDYGDLALETDDMTDNVASVLYGSTVESGVLVDKAGDKAPFGGLAYYRRMMKDGVEYFRGYFYPKVQARLGNENVATRGSSVNFTTESTAFRIYRPKHGEWRQRERFNDEDAAIAWCESKVNVGTWYDVNVTVSGTGTVSPLGIVAAASGTDVVINISGTPTKVYDNGADVTVNVTAGEYTVSDIAVNHTIAVIYSA